MAATARAELHLSFPCGLRGYHVYRTVWNPQLNEILPTVHEHGNRYDRFAIAARKRLPGTTSASTVGHLPKEISRVTRYLLFYGAVVTARVLDTHHRRSPLIQGGLEVPIEVHVKMEQNSRNKDAISKYEALVNQLYKEPVDGTFDDITPSILKDLERETDDQTDDSENDC